MAGIAKLLNGNIFNKSNVKVDLNNKEYQGKTIGLYFSAQWCGPCCEFTPKLSKFYKTYAEKKNFEIIFMSADEDEESFNDYYKEMPWLKFDFKQQKKKEKVEEKLEIESYPTLILFDGDSGEVLCADACDKISDEDPKGKDFPWKSDE